MSALGFHPTHPGWQRLLDALHDDAALLGIDDHDTGPNEVDAALAHRTNRKADQ